MFERSPTFSRCRRAGSVVPFFIAVRARRTATRWAPCQSMSKPKLKLLFFSAVAQCAATAIVISSAWVYWRLFNKEAWPVIVPSLIVALVVEALVLCFALEAKKGAKVFPKIIVATIASWLGGSACFLILDGVAKLLYFQTPKIAWLAALLIIFFLVYRLDIRWSNR